MKLYYHSAFCSLATHIIMRELDIEMELDLVNLTDRTTQSGKNYLDINPNGYVPALVLDDGNIITEVATTLTYLADQYPESGLMPAFGSLERYHALSLLNFVSSEVHKTLGTFFAKENLTEQGHKNVMARLHKRLTYLDDLMSEKAFLTGDTFTVADAYVYTVLNWRNILDVDISHHKNLEAYLERLGSRPAIQSAMKHEGLLK